MILNISGRTDIVNCDSDWKLKRFDEGYVLSPDKIDKNAQLPRENFMLHAPDSPLLIGHLKPTDRLESIAQKTFLKREAQHGR